MLVAGRKLTLADTSGDERVPFGDVTRLRRHLADVAETGRTGLDSAARQIRSAAHDSTVVAVLGRLNPNSLRAVAEAHARGRSSPAYALLLDVDSWVDPRHAAAHPAPVDLARSAEVLRSAGWRTTVVRAGDTTPAVWELLLSGTVAHERRAAAVR